MSLLIIVYLHGSKFEQKMLPTAVQQMLNSASCYIERWNMRFNMLKVAERT